MDDLYQKQIDRLHLMKSTEFYLYQQESDIHLVDGIHNQKDENI